MKTLAGALGGMILGGAIGWFLPGLFVSRPHEFEVLGLLVLRTFGLGIGAITGLIVGGALAARHSEQSGRDGQQQE
jgi:hypothetical protein